MARDATGREVVPKIPADQGAAYTLAVIKPDAFRRKLVGRILTEIEEHDFTITRVWSCHLSVDQVATFYQEHSDKPYYEQLINFMSSGKVLALQIGGPYGEDAISSWRNLMGPYQWELQQPGQIRHKFREEDPPVSNFWPTLMENLVHGSDSVRAYSRESGFLWQKGL